MSDLTGVSLFAGVGGFDLAMERNGVKVVAAVEIDKKCQEVLAHRFPSSKLFDDVTTVKGSDLIGAGFTPSRGIITGGFPCQDLSVAGKRAGLAGARSGLFWEIARIVEETQTEYAILENVPGLLSSNNGADFAVVLGTMADLGYSVAWRVLDAQYFGVPQRRKRVFIACRRASSGSAGEILFKSEGLRRNPTSSQQEGQDSTRTTTESVGGPVLGSGKDIANCLPAELYHHGTVVNQDANNGHVVVTPSSFGGYTEGVGTLRANGGDLGGGSENLVVHKE
jgi:DNA (cytosine-5)-methyltransferase 1